MPTALTVNGKAVEVDADPDTPLLWVLRDHLGMPGTKYGCGIAQCGACTVHVGGEAVRSCQLPLEAAAGADVRTIEGLGGEAGGAVIAAWRALDVVQCGYCQPGQMMQASALLEANRKPTDADIDDAMSGNLCRCATYHRIRLAIHEAARLMEA